MTNYMDGWNGLVCWNYGTTGKNNGYAQDHTFGDIVQRVLGFASRLACAKGLLRRSPKSPPQRGRHRHSRRAKHHAGTQSRGHVAGVLHEWIRGAVGAVSLPSRHVRVTDRGSSSVVLSDQPGRDQVDREHAAGFDAGVDVLPGWPTSGEDM